MLKPTLLQHQEYSQAMYGGMAHPQVGVSPLAPVGKATYAITSYEHWLQAVNLYLSVYLLLPANVPLVVKMLKYAEIIWGLAEEGVTGGHTMRRSGPCGSLGGGRGTPLIGNCGSRRPNQSDGWWVLLFSWVPPFQARVGPCPCMSVPVSATTGESRVTEPHVTLHKSASHAVGVAIPWCGIATP